MADKPILASFADRISLPDLSLAPNDALTPSRIRIELLSGLTVALALVPPPLGRHRPPLAGRPLQARTRRRSPPRRWPPSTQSPVLV